MNAFPVCTSSFIRKKAGIQCVHWAHWTSRGKCYTTLHIVLYKAISYDWTFNIIKSHTEEMWTELCCLIKTKESNTQPQHTQLYSRGGTEASRSHFSGIVKEGTVFCLFVLLHATQTHCCVHTLLNVHTGWTCSQHLNISTARTHSHTTCYYHSTMSALSCFSHVKMTHTHPFTGGSSCSEGRIPRAVGRIEQDLISISLQFPPWASEGCQQAPRPSETHINTQAKDSSWENLTQRKGYALSWWVTEVLV